MPKYDLDATLIQWSKGADTSFSRREALSGGAAVFGATGSGKTSGCIEATAPATTRMKRHPRKKAPGTNTGTVR